MGDMTEHPRLLHTVLDTTDVRGLAEFYRELLGLRYRPGDEPPPGAPDDAQWLVLTTADGARQLAFQLTDRLPPTTWPEPDVPMQLHLVTVSSREELERQRGRAESLGARQPLYVLADPAVPPAVEPYTTARSPSRPRTAPRCRR